jgi:hypothetical protein
MKIIFDWPPDTTTEDKKKSNVATTYKGDIYCPNGPVRDDVIEHEKKHIEQYGDDYDGWIKKCESDNKFYIDQEIEAYRAQLEFIEKTRGRADRLTATLSFAKFLSSDVYNNNISIDEALKKLTT